MTTVWEAIFGKKVPEKNVHDMKNDFQVEMLKAQLQARQIQKHAKVLEKQLAETAYKVAMATGRIE